MAALARTRRPSRTNSKPDQRGVEDQAAFSQQALQLDSGARGPLRAAAATR